jgi:hypothetical protein
MAFNRNERVKARGQKQIKGEKRKGQGGEVRANGQEGKKVGAKWAAANQSKRWKGRRQK